MDPVKRATVFIRRVETNPYELDVWNIAYWYREA